MSNELFGWVVGSLGVIAFIAFMQIVPVIECRNVVRRERGQLRDFLEQIKTRSQTNFRRPLVVGYHVQDNTDLIGAGSVDRVWYVGEAGGRKVLGIIPRRRWLFVLMTNHMRNGKLECAVVDPTIVNIVKEEAAKYASAIGAKDVDVIEDFNFHRAQA